MAQELIGGATFTLLYDGVKKALDETATFKYLLKDLKFTLESLTRLRTTAIQQIRVYNVELGLPNEEIEDLERRMEEGAKLVEKLSNSRLWKWNYCCISCYIDQLVDLDRALRRLLENLKLQDARDVKELLELSRNQRNNHKELDEVKGLLLNIEKLLQQKEEDVVEALASGRNTETIPDPNEGNGGEQVALLEGVDALRAAFGMLFDAVKEVKDKNKMFKPLLVYLKSTLDCLKPLIEEIAQHNKVLNLPKEELKNFRIQMEKGVELIHKCSKVRLWASYKKHKYTDKLLGLDESLQTLLHVLKMQVARDVNVVPAISNIEAVIKQIEGSGVVQNQIQTKGLCAVPKPSLPTVQLDALGVQGTRDVNEAAVLITNITEVGVMQIEGSDVVQNHNEIKGESGNDSRNRVSNTSSSAGSSPFLETESLRMDQSQTDGKVLEKSNLRAFSFAELKASTRKFRPEAVVGEGGFGKVFKGWVNEKTLAPSKPFKGMTVAIKKFNPQGFQGFPEWQSEMNFLGKVSHPNLIKLLGYCTEKEELLLVYEFMPRGSLGNQLFTRSATVEPLSWDNRLKIAIEAAQGLAFLHTLEEQVIHRNIKSSTILLDGNYNAKISGLGLAKLGPTDGESHVSTRVMGTFGYAAPEYVATGYLYVKSDLYSFGVVLLEILTGLRVIDKNRPREQHNLVEWAKPLLSHKRKLKTIMDVRIEGQYSFKAALQTAHVTLKCLEPDPKKRPSMKEVVEALQQIQAINGKPKQSKLTSKQSS